MAPVLAVNATSNRNQNELNAINAVFDSVARITKASQNNADSGTSVIVLGPLLLFLLLLMVGCLIVLHNVGLRFRHRPTTDSTFSGQTISQDYSSVIGVTLSRPQSLGFVVPQIIVTLDTFTRSKVAAEAEEQQSKRKDSFSDW